MKFNPMPHQSEAYSKLKQFNNRLLAAHDPGCLHEDTIVTINYRMASKKVTLKKLYDLWTVPRKKQIFKTYKPVDYKKDVKVRSYNHTTGVFQLYDLEDVIYSGEKETIKLYFEEDKFLICTKDHKIFTHRGWIEADKLDGNDNIYSNGINLKCRSCGTEKFLRTNFHKWKNLCHTCYAKEVILKWYCMSKDDYITLASGLVKFHPHVNKGNVGMPKHRLVYEAFLNKISYDDWLSKIINGDFSKNDIFLSPKVVIHHKDKNKQNCDISNLIMETSSGHAKLHSKIDNIISRLPIMIPKKLRMIKKENYGISRTYDLKIKDSHCFVANSILVHNSGKTFSSLNISNIDNKKCLIVAPKKLKHQWRNQIVDHGFGVDQDIIVCYEKEQLIDALFQQKKFIIFHYEMLRELEVIEELLNCVYKYNVLKKWVKKDELKLYMRKYEVFKSGQQKVLEKLKEESDKTGNEIKKGYLQLKENDEELFKKLSALNHSDYILIIDEMYKLKNYKAKLSKAFHFITRFNFSSVIGLDGTPHYNVPWETQNIANIIRPGVLPYEMMINKFAYKTDWGEWKYRNLKGLNEYLQANVMHRVRIEDIEANMPKVVHQNYELDATAASEKLKEMLISKVGSIFEIYTTLRVIDSYYNSDLMGDTGTEVNTILRNYKEVEIIQEEKLETLTEILEQIDGKKIIIFSSFERTVRWLASKLKGYKSAIVTGNTKDKDFNDISRNFKDGDTQILFATDSLSKGFDAPLVEYLLNWDITPSNSTMQQRRARIRRMTNVEFEKPKVVMNLIGSIIEREIVEIIERKQKMFNVVVNGVEQTEEDIVKENDIMRELARKWGIKIRKEKA